MELILLGFREVLGKCQPLCFGAGEQHPARPERVFVRNRRLGVDLSSANAHLCTGNTPHLPCSKVLVCLGSGSGLRLGLALGCAAPPYYQPLCTDIFSGSLYFLRIFLGSLPHFHYSLSLGRLRYFSDFLWIQVYEQKSGSSVELHSKRAPDTDRSRLFNP